MQDALHRLLAPLSAHWLVGIVLAISLAWSLGRRFRWSRQSTEVNTVAKAFGFVPLDKLPIARNDFDSFDSSLGWGRVHNILTGSVGGNEVVLFDTEVAHPHYDPTLQTIAAFRLIATPLPDFSLRPKSVLDNVRSVLGKNVDFGDDSSFSQDYFLACADVPGARACFTPEFRNFFEVLERYDSKKNWHVQKRGVWVIVYRKNEGVEPDDLQTFLQGTAEIARNLESASEGKRLS